MVNDVSSGGFPAMPNIPGTVGLQIVPWCLWWCLLHRTQQLHQHASGCGQRHPYADTERLRWFSGWCRSRQATQGCSTLSNDEERKQVFDACETGSVAILAEGVGLVCIEDVEGAAAQAGEHARVGLLPELRRAFGEVAAKVEAQERSASETKEALRQLAPKIEDIAGFVKHRLPTLVDKSDLTNAIAGLRAEIEKRPTRRQAILDMTWVFGLIGSAIAFGSRAAR